MKTIDNDKISKEHQNISFVEAEKVPSFDINWMNLWSLRVSVYWRLMRSSS